MVHRIKVGNARDNHLPLLLFILFLVIPILEIAAFIQIGSLIGLWPTLAGILLTAIAGAWLVRMQGLQTLNEAQQAGARGELPVGPLFHGVFILIAGLLLLTPGFVTDTLGFALLVPPLRRLIGAKVWDAVKDKVEIHTPDGGHHGSGRPHPPGGAGPVIDGEAEEVTDAPATGHTDAASDTGRIETGGHTGSPWRKN